MELLLKIKDIKNIKKGEFSFSMDKGIYCIVGPNGSGKSTIMRSLAQMIFSSSLQELHQEDFNSESLVSFEMDTKRNVWKYDKACGRWESDVRPIDRIHFYGMYEGSLFYGTRFDDSLSVDKLYKESTICRDDLAEVDQYVKEKLSFILFKNLGSFRV